MKKIKKTFLYIFGSFMVFAFDQTGPMPEYGIGFISEPTLSEPTLSEPTLGERILSVILSPIVMVIIIVLAIIIGTVVFIKRSRKNAKKNS